MFNVIRPQPGPQSLQNHVRYDSEDVYNALKECFFDKCYLCETKNPHDVNIEHFVAHEGDSERKFAWNNLYYVCSRCNNIKSNRFNELLDCCDPATDVFRHIVLLPPRTPFSEKVDIEAKSEEDRTQNTKRLLDLIYNNDNTVNKRVTGSYLRQQIFDRLVILNKHIINYFAHDATADDKNSALEKMKVLISKESAYSSFLRWVVLGDKVLAPQLEEFMD